MKNLILIFTILISNLTFAANPKFSMEEATIHSIQKAITSHQINCEQLINIYLDRIKKFNLNDGTTPSINAITQLNPFALDAARNLDKQFLKNKTLAGPLHCIPVILKDNINTYDMTTTAGSFSLLGNQPVKDAFLVKKLRDAGAIILAHGTMDEFASGMYGISSRSGRTGNVYDTSQNPGGSSAGEGAAVSANFAVIGIGSDNSGSVRIPAAFNGITGLRPSTGLISQQGIYPAGNLDGVPGPMTRTVEDLAIVLNVIAQPDSADPKTLNIQRPKSYTGFLNKNGLQGKRIGIVHEIGKIDAFNNMPTEIKTVINAAVKQKDSLGAQFVTVNLSKFDNNRRDNMAGMVEDINAYLAEFPATRKSVGDICESDRTRSFGNIEECLKFMRSIPSHTSQAYRNALNIFAMNKAYVENIMQTNHLDALLIPISNQGVASYDPYAVNTWQAPVASNAGLPSITLNIGYSHELPIGLELIGKQFDEAKLIEIAYAYEQNTHNRKVPVMPKENKVITKMNISELNNLFSLIGATTYEKVLKEGKRNEFARLSLAADKAQEIIDSLQR